MIRIGKSPFTDRLQAIVYIRAFWSAVHATHRTRCPDIEFPDLPGIFAFGRDVDKAWHRGQADALAALDLHRQRSLPRRS